MFVSKVLLRMNVTPSVKPPSVTPGRVSPVTGVVVSSACSREAELAAALLSGQRRGALYGRLQSDAPCMAGCSWRGVSPDGSGGSALLL